MKDFINLNGKSVVVEYVEDKDSKIKSVTRRLDRSDGFFEISLVHKLNTSCKKVDRFFSVKQQNNGKRTNTRVYPIKGNDCALPHKYMFFIADLDSIMATYDFRRLIELTKKENYLALTLNVTITRVDFRGSKVICDILFGGNKAKKAAEILHGMSFVSDKTKFKVVKNNNIETVKLFDFDLTRLDEDDNEGVMSKLIDESYNLRASSQVNKMLVLDNKKHKKFMYLIDKL